jgi:hypothetical protein
MSIAPNIIMICINMQGEDHYCQEEQDFLGIPAKTKITSQFVGTGDKAISSLALVLLLQTRC